MDETGIIAVNDFDVIREKIMQNEFSEAISLIDSIPILHLTCEDMKILTELVAGLPQDMVQSSTDVCYKMALLHIIMGNVRNARSHISALNALRENLAEGSPERAVLENRLFVLGIALPQKDNSSLLLNLAVLSHNAAEAKISSAHISVTNKFPSVLRGSKDLSDWGKNYRAVESIIQPYLGVLLEDSAAGVCDVGVAELLYEKNYVSDASLRVIGGVNANNPEVAFAALVILARIGAVDNTAKSPDEILPRIEKMLRKKNALDLLPNFEAFKTRCAILRGDTNAIRIWLENCNIDDLGDCSKINSYILITKARAYIALGEYGQAASLMESLILMLQADYRPLDTADCLIGSAIAMDMLNREDVAFQKLERALLLAQEYGYIRVFADHGKQAFHLLTKYSREHAFGDEINGLFLKKVIEASDAFSLLLPSIYEQREERKDSESALLTQSEIHVLQLLEQGSTNNTIAKELDIKLPTVKFHISNICEKLSASNRVEAIKEARERGLLI